MSSPHRGRPSVSSLGVLRQAAQRFVPTYEIEEEAPWALVIKLRDPQGRHPDLTLRHRHDRRLFFRANYLVVESNIPGDGPPADGELAFRFHGSLRRRKASLRWRGSTRGEEWTSRLEEPLVSGLRRIEAVESLRITWAAETRTWHLRLKTLSGSMVGGFMTAMPIAVPLDRKEAEGIISLVDALAATGRGPASAQPPPPD
ncbi:MAG: hypothetical protein ACRDHS_09205 [Actinomycetota bacterium]